MVVFRIYLHFTEVSLSEIPNMLYRWDNSVCFDIHSSGSGFVQCLCLWLEASWYLISTAVDQMFLIAVQQRLEKDGLSLSRGTQTCALFNFTESFKGFPPHQAQGFTQRVAFAFHLPADKKKKTLYIVMLCNPVTSGKLKSERKIDTN